jgi:hypothetical protein
MLSNGFNRSVWSALWVIVPMAVAGGGIVLYFAHHHGRTFFVFDPKHNRDSRLEDEKGEFAPHSARYQDLAKLVIALSVGAIALLINFLIGFKPPETDFAAKLINVSPIAVGFFGACVAMLIGFMILQTLWYEEYCHRPRHDSYRAWKYALCNVLGWTAIPGMDGEQ